MWTNPSDSEIRDLIRRSRTIAVVGLSPKSERASHRVARYLKGQGHTIIPVNPEHAELLEETCYPHLTAIPADLRIDIVDLFRRSSEVGPIVDEAIARGVGAIWMQLGVVDEEAARRAAAAGILVVMDRCLMVEHAALVES
jgi:predicted CoA-binding protein